MPRIVRDLNTTLGYVQAALVLLALVKAAFTPTSENLSQRYGRKRVYLGGLLLFSLGTIAAATSANMGFFVAAYALLTGLGGTPLTASPRDLIERIYTDQAERLAQLALIVCSVLGGLSGALLGGWIASVYGWRWSFLPELLLVPLIMFLLRKVPNPPPTAPPVIDWVGGLLSFLGLGFTLLGISLAGEYGWWEPRERFTILNVVLPPFGLSIVPPLIAAGIICLGIFAAWQRRQKRQGKASLLRVGLLRHYPFLIGMFTAAMHTLITTGVQFNLYQFIPAVLQLNPFQTALTVLPFSLAQLVVVVFTTFKVVGRYPAKTVIYAGLSMFCVGVWQLYTAIDSRITSLSLMPSLVVMGAGSGLFLAQIGITTFEFVRQENRAEASGIYSPVQNLGTALGRAILGTVLVAAACVKIVDGAIAQLGQAVTPEQREQAIYRLSTVVQTYTQDERRTFFANLPAALQPSLYSILTTSTIDAMRIAILVTLAFSFLCLFLAFFIPKRSTVQLAPQKGARIK
jgi:MFS family permease